MAATPPLAEEEPMCVPSNDESWELQTAAAVLVDPQRHARYYQAENGVTTMVQAHAWKATVDTKIGIWIEPCTTKDGFVVTRVQPDSLFADTLHVGMRVVSVQGYELQYHEVHYAVPNEMEVRRAMDRLRQAVGLITIVAETLQARLPTDDDDDENDENERPQSSRQEDSQSIRENQQAANGSFYDDDSPVPGRANTTETPLVDAATGVPSPRQQDGEQNCNNPQTQPTANTIHDTAGQQTNIKQDDRPQEDPFQWLFLDEHDDSQPTATPGATATTYASWQKADSFDSDTFHVRQPASPTANNDSDSLNQLLQELPPGMDALYVSNALHASDGDIDLARQLCWEDHRARQLEEQQREQPHAQEEERWV